jgi:hypothetical protein
MALTPRYSPAPQPSYRLIPSQFPPIGLFDTVARAADLEPVLDLVGWTNDRLVSERLARLPQSEWAFGRANSSIVMAAFLHASPLGARFSGPDLGAWYAASSLQTAIAEVAHHLRREAYARRQTSAHRRFRGYQARLVGNYRDIRGEAQGDLHAPDSYVASQKFGEQMRAAGEAGIIYDSQRHRDGVSICAFRPSKVQDVVQAEHLDIAVRTDVPTISVGQIPA